MSESHGGTYWISRLVHWLKGAPSGISGRSTGLPHGWAAWSSMQFPFPMQNIPSHSLGSIPTMFEWEPPQSGAGRLGTRADQLPPGHTQPGL
jgi:hypothetical protein